MRVNGVILLDKPHGMSSNHALQAVRRLYMAEKAGHTGTLDPMATGLLPLCLGEATKFSGELLGADKRYLATVQLGLTTDTADAEGTPLLRRPVTAGDDEILATLARFQGEIRQIPPMHSALKRHGKPLYAYAREGIEVERAPRTVRIHSLSLIERTKDAFVIDVHCSKGTYIRTLAADIGEALGCGAHLSALRRTAVDALTLDDTLSLPELERQDIEQRLRSLLPPDHLLRHLGSVQLEQALAVQIGHGQAIHWPGEPGTRLRLYAPPTRFLGIGRITPDGKLQPERLIASVSA